MDGIRFKMRWVDQNMVEVDDLQTEDLFCIGSCVAALERFDKLKERDPNLANMFFEGFLDGINFCDNQLKYVTHNFVRRE